MQVRGKVVERGWRRVKVRGRTVVVGEEVGEEVGVEVGGGDGAGLALGRNPSNKDSIRASRSSERREQRACGRQGAASAGSTDPSPEV